MDFFGIKPYVRFARIQKNIRPSFVVGLDHRIFYCASGSGEITAGGKAYTMEAGSFLFIKAGIVYKNSSQNKETTLLAYNFDLVYNDKNVSDPIPYVNVEDCRPDMLIEPICEIEKLDVPDVIYYPNFFEKEIFEEIIAEYQNKAVYSVERCSILLKDVLIRVNRKLAYSSNKLGRAEEILSYVREHFCENISNADVAEHFSYHINYINQIIKKHTGKTLHRYLLEYRVNAAAKLLGSGEYSVSEVSSLLGFSEISHFTRCFRKITGEIPSAYRNK